MLGEIMLAPIPVYLSEKLNLTQAFRQHPAPEAPWMEGKWLDRKQEFTCHRVQAQTDATHYCIKGSY